MRELISYSEATICTSENAFYFLLLRVLPPACRFLEVRFLLNNVSTIARRNEMVRVSREEQLLLLLP